MISESLSSLSFGSGSGMKALIIWSDIRPVPYIQFSSGLCTMGK